MAAGLHTLMRHANDADAIVCLDVEDNVLCMFETEIAVSQMGDRAPDTWRPRQTFKTVMERKKVVVRLSGPKLSIRILIDFHQVSLSFLSQINPCHFRAWPW